MKSRIPCLIALSIIVYSCGLPDGPIHEKVTTAITEKPASSPPNTKATPFNAAKILATPQVPILCFHRIRAFKPTDTRSMKDYIVPIETFRAEIKALADSGYHTILPDQLYAYLTTGASLPSKPI